MSASEAYQNQQKQQKQQKNSKTVDLKNKNSKITMLVGFGVSWGGCLASREGLPLKTSLTFAVFAIPNVGFAVFLLSFAVFAVFAGFEAIDLQEKSSQELPGFVSASEAYQNQQKHQKPTKKQQKRRFEEQKQ